ncbi:ABC transporter ATP-binding protein [Streptomyces otsuchiensis]|uniref:ABC transporter ATP-binding protein n=1 Tax=Streptomyces otsuchiensis TaxID=2681388 RepID=UPI0010318166|nr:ABC transporter ATP-binding protein [Streptomyces otsuchiensis]
MTTPVDAGNAPGDTTATAPTETAPSAPPPETPPPWQVLLGYIRPHRRLLALGALLSLTTGAAGLALPLVARQLIDDLSADRGVAGLLALMTLLVLVNACLGALGGYVLQRAAESVVLQARRSLTSHLLRLRISAVDRSEPGDLISRATADPTLLSAMTTEALIGMGTGGLLLVATLVMMAVLDVVLLAVTLGVIGLTSLVIAVVSPRIRAATKQAQESVGLIGATLERSLGALRTVKAAGAEPREERAVHAATDESWRQRVRAALWQAIASNAAGLSTQVAFLTVLGVGGARVAGGQIDIGTLVAFLLYVFYLMLPVSQFVRAIAQYNVGSAAVSRIQEAHALPAEPVEAAAAPLPAPAGEPASVTFREVRFRYGPELPEIHHGVSFTVPPRGMTAFVGPSGAGKSTLFSLIERFYDPTDGEILVDGREIRSWDLHGLRAAIGYVEQDAPVLSGSLRDNLLLGAPDVTGERLHEALRTARLDGLVDRLPEGLDTPVGHRGTRLSGGERQRVAIARALLRNPRLLLLDEATSQLDAVNEAALRDTVAEVARETTVLVVAHRLSTVVLADRIIVVDAGRVRAVGTHAELVREDRLYAELAATQFLSGQD